MTRATDLIRELKAIADPAAVMAVSRFFRGTDPTNRVMGVPIGKIFPVAKRYAGLDLADVERLLDDLHYEVRMAAMAVLDFKARQKRLSGDERQALFKVYMAKHDRINNWDLVDRAAPHVVGGYLLDKDRGILDQLARSNDPNERRTALVATHAFIKKGETADTFRIATILAADTDDYVQKAIAPWTREAGKRDQQALEHFLKANNSRLPRSTITAASKLLPATVRAAVRA